MSEQQQESRSPQHSPLLGRLGLALLWVAASTAQAQYPHADEPIADVRSIYDGRLLPDEAVNSFRNIDRLFATRVVERGEQVRDLPYRLVSLEDFSFSSAGEQYDLYDYLTLNRVTGLLALKNGAIAVEIYLEGNSEQTRWMSMSIAKSITASLVGAAIADGYIESLDALITDYVPALQGSGYEGVRVRDVLQMASGVSWNETYTDSSSDRRELLEAQIAQQPDGMLDVMANLPKVAEPGSVFNYSTGETQIAAHLLDSVLDQTIASYLTEKIWAGYGMEADANWWLDSPDGVEVGGSGFSATLRDYGRFGQYLLEGGIINGEPTLPAGWIEGASSPHIVGGESVDYGYMLWPNPDREGTIHETAYQAIGIFGQYVYINPGEDTVIVVWSARVKPTGRDIIDDNDFFGALTETLR